MTVISKSKQVKWVGSYGSAKGGFEFINEEAF